MICDQCRDLMTDYVHGELDAARDASVFEHVQTCAGCKAEWDAQTALTETLRTAYAHELELPMSVVAGVRQAVRTERAASVISALRNWLKPAVLAPAAAALLLIFGVARYNQVHTAQNMPQLSADYFVRQHLAKTMGSQSNDRAYSEYLLTSANDQQSNAVTP